MSKKEAASSDGTGKKAQSGRPPSKRAKEFSWYGCLEEFETGHSKPWWEDGIDWVKETQARKATRSVEPRESFTCLAHPGFLWEALRRYPEAQKLIDALSALSTDASDGMTLSEEKLIGAQQGSVRLTTEVGLNVKRVLDVLRKCWKHSFDRIPEEPKEVWMRFYVDLWHRVGKRGTVPTKPPDAPEPFKDIGENSAAAAFDLLIGVGSQNSCSDSGGVFDELPHQTIFLKQFAKLRPGIERFNEPVSSFAQGKTKPITYPWLSFGILNRRLAKIQMHPLALAVDFTKSTDSIMRDIRHLIDIKRKILGLKVADRRIRKESFDMISRLDKEICFSAKKIPLARTVKEFENSAQLDVNELLSLVETIRDQSSAANHQTLGLIHKAVAYCESNPLGRSSKKSSKKAK
jgi:hypothetical protein